MAGLKTSMTMVLGSLWKTKKGEPFPSPCPTETDKDKDNKENNKHSNDNDNEFAQPQEEQANQTLKNTRLPPILYTEENIFEFLCSFWGNLSLPSVSEEYVNDKYKDKEVQIVKPPVGRRDGVKLEKDNNNNNNNVKHEDGVNDKEN